MVAGLELTRTVVTPSSRRALHACVPGVVELGRLPDDDGAGADDEDFVGFGRHLQLVRLGHSDEGCADDRPNAAGGQLGSRPYDRKGVGDIPTRVCVRLPVSNGPSMYYPTEGGFSRPAHP